LLTLKCNSLYNIYNDVWIIVSNDGIIILFCWLWSATVCIIYIMTCESTLKTFPLCLLIYMSCHTPKGNIIIFYGDIALWEQHIAHWHFKICVRFYWKCYRHYEVSSLNVSVQQYACLYVCSCMCLYDYFLLLRDVTYNDVRADIKMFFPFLLIGLTLS
jgi:hypothetical protein